MKRIALKTMKISNFKGLRELSIDFDECTTNIYGDNATGKTTIFDAFIWLLFDKDSRNSKSFNIKPLANNGSTAQKGVEPTVEASIDVDGQVVLFQKTYKEKWTKKRGSVDQVFDGHETHYFIDQVPKKKNEFEKYIETIVPEDVFRLLTDVQYFNNSLHWQERRNIILDMCGNVTDADVIDSNPKLKLLRGHLVSRTIDELKKMLSSQRKKINDERDELPVRIDEAYKSIVDGIDEASEKQSIEELEAQVAILTTDIEVNTGSDIIDKQIFEIDRELNDLKNANSRFISEQEMKFNDANAELFKKRNDIKSIMNTTRSSFEVNSNTIRTLEKTLAELREEYAKIDAMKWSGDEICPTCGQTLPEGKIRDSKEQFNIFKSDQLIANNKIGKSKKSELEQLKSQQDELQETLNDLAIQLEYLPAEQEFQPQDMDGFEDKRSALIQKKATLTLKRQDSSESNLVAEKQSQIQKLQDQINEHRSKLLTVENNQKQYERISELEYKEQSLAKQLEELDQQLFLTDEFTKTKVHILEEKINKAFKLAKFKLFDVQINGGVSECCEATHDGVPYADLNNAMRINIGIDIINALARFYGVSAPIFIDNAESVTELLATPGQAVRLVVSGEDKELRICRESSMQKGVA